MVSVSKAVFHALAASRGMKTLASRYGMRRPDSFARRFVAGETLAEAIAAARRIEADGRTLTLDFLGESVASMAEADRATCVDNLRRILDPAAAREFFVRIDMEDSRYTQVTLDVFDTLWQQGYRNTGIVLQSYLHRSVEDARRMNQLGARVRLVKGAYKEPRSVAYQSKAQVDATFVEIMRLLLIDGTSPAIATHDPAMIDATKAFAAERGIPADRYEFQMLYGIRRDLQQALVAQGYRVRVYLPFGREWFPYFMRRIGERPANLGFVVRSLLKDR